MLFVASWCAPCRAELARLDDIAAAIKPVRVLVVPADTDPRTQAMLRGIAVDRVWHADDASDRAAMRTLLGDTAGLPYSVMTDAAGRPCAFSKRGLDRVEASAMRARCN